MEDQSAPATKQDVAAAEQRLEEKIDEKIEQLRSEVNDGYRDIVERVSDAETRLLKAFYDFAQSSQKRMSDLETSDSGIRSRLATLEDRLLEVEKRLNMPPAA